MIRRQVSAAVLLRDGFTGRVLTGGTVCRLDGQPLRPLWKPEGYLILENLVPGSHRLELLRGGFCPAELTLEIRFKDYFRALRASYYPGVIRLDDFTVSYTARTMDQLMAARMFIL